MTTYSTELKKPHVHRHRGRWRAILPLQLPASEAVRIFRLLRVLNGS